ncbi:hypothetical protein ACN6QZ_15580, partial [Acinetobacter baumannii]
MIKKILLSFIAIFTVVSGIIIFYWRDVQYNPNKIDFFLYFLLLPAIITLVILSPCLLYTSPSPRDPRRNLGFRLVV